MAAATISIIPRAEQWLNDLSPPKSKDAIRHKKVAAEQLCIHAYEVATQLAVTEFKRLQLIPYLSPIFTFCANSKDENEQLHLARIGRVFLEYVCLDAQKNGLALPPDLAQLNEVIRQIFRAASKKSVVLRFEMCCAANALEWMKHPTRHFARLFFETLKDPTSPKMLQLTDAARETTARRNFSVITTINWFAPGARTDINQFTFLHKLYTDFLADPIVALAGAQFLDDLVWNGKDQLPKIALEASHGLGTLVNYRSQTVREIVQETAGDAKKRLRHEIDLPKWSVRLLTVQLLSKCETHADEIIARKAAKLIYLQSQQPEKHSAVKALTVALVQKMALHVNWRSRREEAEEAIHDFFKERDRAAAPAAAKADEEEPTHHSKRRKVESDDD